MKRLIWIIACARIGALLTAWLLPSVDIHPHSRNEGALAVIILVLAASASAIRLAFRLERNERNGPPGP